MKQYNGTEIAIIGMSCQFPGANDASEFWQNLKSGKESITRFSKEELLAAGIPEQTVNDPNYISARGELEGAAYFDAPFFGFRPVEAQMMDPQMRVFYQHCWKAIEDAAYDLNDYQDKIGLFAGASPNNNWENAAIFNYANGEVDEVTATQLRNVAYMSTRISYKFNLTGPSIYLNTTCSSSLVAIQRACMSLLLRESKMSLAGGVFITNFPDRGYTYQEGLIYSKDGYCRAFDEQASGTVAGEGVGVVLLKRLDDAIKEGDPIHAVIKGSGINNDGSQKASYTAPGSDGQQEVIMKALKMAKVPKESISYIETHGTGTALGDVIEMDALKKAYGPSNEQYCAVGSVKTNVGHMIAASGVAGLIKTVMALKHKQLPPSLNFEKENPKLKLTGSPFHINNQLTEWTAGNEPRRAGVSSFGIGGTNAHVILEEWTASAQPKSEKKNQVFVFSAKSENALNNNMHSFRKFLLEKPETHLADAALTLQKGRVAFDYRKTLVASTIRDLIVKMRVPEDIPFTKKTSAGKSPLVFMFSGQGSQYAKMGEALMQYPAFQLEAANCFKLLHAHTGKDFTKIWQDEALIHETENSQPLLFVLEYAIAKLLMDFGIVPDLMIGHSIGEYTAACISEMISLEDALKLVVKRGELMQQARPGKMLSVSLSRDELLPYLEDHSELKLAASNSSELSVVAGTSEAIADLQKDLEAKEIRTRLLVTSHAFHSEMMRTAVSPFFNEAKNVKFKTGKIPVISSKMGQRVTSEMLDPGYWSDQIADEVQFAKALELIFKEEALLLEVGPGNALATFARSHQKRSQQVILSSLPKHDEEVSTEQFLLKTLGKLWENDIQPDWKRIKESKSGNRIHLPTYQFDQIVFPHLVDAEKIVGDLIADSKGISRDVTDWLHQEVWEIDELSEVSEKDQPMLFFQVDPARKNSLQTAHPNATFVRFGTEFEQYGKQDFIIHPESPEDYHRLFETLGLNGAVTISYFLTQGEHLTTELGVKENYQYLIHLTKALGNTTQLSAIDLLLISFNAHKINASEQVAPYQSLAIGASRVINKEYAHVQARCIDMSVQDDQWVENFKQEIGAEESIIAYRGGMRFSQSFKRSKKALEPKETLKNGACYLITGGTGGIGMALAKEIASAYEDITFIMLGRRALPEKVLWKGSENPVAETYAALESKGATVHYFSVDLGNAKTIKKVLEQVDAIGTVDGVIHAAGIVDKGGIIPTRDLSTDDNLIASKVYGTMHLLSALDVPKLDFFLLCSSAAAIKAPAGEVAYVATNTFLNSISANYPKVRTIGWNAWSESGMAAEIGQVDKRNSVTDQQGYVLFRTAISARQKTLIVSSYELNQEPDSQVHTSQVDHPIETTDLKGVSDSVEARLMKLWESFFGKTDISLLDNFFEIGGDSLKALTMINWIKDEFGIIMTVQSFFEYDTVKSLANFLEISLADQKEEDTYEVIDI